TADRSIAARFRAWLDAIDPAVRSAARRTTLHLGVGVAIIVVVAVGLRGLEQRGHAMPRFTAPLRVEWIGLPDWLRAPANQHIVADLTEACGLTLDDRIFDPQLAQRVAARLAAADLAWVAALRRVEVRSD